MEQRTAPKTDRGTGATFGAYRFQKRRTDRSTGRCENFAGRH